MKRTLAGLAVMAGMLAAVPAAHATTFPTAGNAASETNISSRDAAQLGMDSTMNQIYQWGLQDWHNRGDDPCPGPAEPAMWRSTIWLTPWPGDVPASRVYGTAYGPCYLFLNNYFQGDYYYAQTYGGATDTTYNGAWHNRNWWRRQVCKVIYHELGHNAGYGHYQTGGPFGDTMNKYTDQQHTPSKCANAWP